MIELTDDERKKQRQRLADCPPELKYAMTIQVMEEGKNLIASGVRNDFPGISDLDCKIETFRRMYKHDFTEEQFQNIFEAFRSANNE